MPLVRALGAIPLLVSAGGCRLGDLLSPAEAPPLEETVRLSVDPPAIHDSATADDDHVHAVPLRLLAEGEGQHAWTVAERSGSGWLRLDATRGTAPGRLTVLLDPDDLAPGTYRDTLDFTFPEQPKLSLEVPVEYTILEEADDDDDCPVPNISVGSTIQGEVVPDCPSPIRSKFFASLYRLAGERGDRLTFLLTGAGFDPRLIVYDGEPAASTVLAESVGCPGGNVHVCIQGQVLPRTGAYTVEVSSRKKGKQGAFVLLVTED